MPHYRVYDARQIPDLGAPPITRAGMQHTHVLVHELEAATLGEVYHRMQAESWKRSELDTFMDRLEELGVLHTSMSAGDVVEAAHGTMYECMMFTGWRELEEHDDDHPDDTSAAC